MDAAMGEARDGPRSTVRFNNTKHSAADRRSPIRTHNSTYGRQPTLEQNLAYERPVESLAYCTNAQDTNIRELTTASLTRLRGIKDVMAGSEKRPKFDAVAGRGWPGQARPRHGLASQAPFERLTGDGGATPHPAAFGRHLLPQGEKGRLRRFATVRAWRWWRSVRLPRRRGRALALCWRIRGLRSRVRNHRRSRRRLSHASGRP